MRELLNKMIGLQEGETVVKGNVTTHKATDKYGAGEDEPDEDDGKAKKAEPSEKRGRGRPSKEVSTRSSTGDAAANKKYSADALHKAMSTPKNLKDWMEQLDKAIVNEDGYTVAPLPGATAIKDASGQVVATAANPQAAAAFKNGDITLGGEDDKQGMAEGDEAQSSQPVIPQDQIAKAWTQNKSKAQMFIKNVPVAIMPTSKLPPNSVDIVKQEAGKRDQTSYSPEKFAKGLAAMQAPKQGKGEVYIFDQSSMANYGPYSSQITPALSEYLQQLGIDSAIAKLYIKKVPTPFIPASVFGIEGKRIQTSWGDQAVDSGAFITQEANGHTYCCNPDSEGLPIGYIPAQQGVAEAQNDYFKRRKDEEDRIAGTKAPAKRTPKQTDYEKKRKEQDKDIAEGGMPSSVIKSKQRYGDMSDKDFAELHQSKSDDDLVAMAWRHGYGKGSLHYVNKRKRGLARVEESRLYYNVIGTRDKDLKESFGMQKDQKGWFLEATAGRKRILEAHKAFGAPTIL